jgi:hypothetical protein
MTIREGLPTVIHNGLTYHKALGNNTELLADDWIRVYTGENCTIKDLLFSCDYKDVDNIPNNILDIEYDDQANWLIGGNLAVDFIIYNK